MVARPGERDVEAAPFGFEFGLAEGPRMRHQSLFAADDDHCVELEALGRVKGRELHALAGQGLLLDDQASIDRGEEVPHAVVSGRLLAQHVQVRQNAGVLVLAREPAVVARELQDKVDQGRRGLSRVRAQGRDLFEEGLDSFAGGGLETVDLASGSAPQLQPGDGSLSFAAQRLLRYLADAAWRDVEHGPEVARRRVLVQSRERQIGQDVAHLSLFEQAVAIDELAQWLTQLR